jgi:hypothetical protein
LTAYVVNCLVEFMDAIVKVTLLSGGSRRGGNSSSPSLSAILPTPLSFSQQPPRQASSTDNGTGQHAEA